ncbi:MAG: glycosyltransferase family 61 protein [Nodosilinea sp.]
MKNLKDAKRALLYTAKNYAKSVAKSILDFWRQALNREETISFLEGSAVYEEQDEPIKLPAYRVNEKHFIKVNAFRSSKHMNTDWIDYEREYVWRLERSSKVKHLSLCSSGSILINNKILIDLDFGATAGYRDFPFKPDKLHFPVVIAPWSHLGRLGYFDFMFLVLTKLCLVEKVLGPEILRTAKLCYPALYTQFESEYLSKLGISRNTLVDTRSETRVTADCVILSNNQSCLGRVSPTNLSLLRQRFMPPEPVTPKRKLLLLRKHTRRLVNQAEVVDLVRQYDFEIISDTYRTVDEQIQLFRQATVIIAPHGAALANLVWCSPGTQVVEFLNGNYSPPFFCYLCRLLDLRYDCLVDYTKGHLSHVMHKTDNVRVDIELLKKKMNQISARS